MSFYLSSASCPCGGGFDSGGSVRWMPTTGAALLPAIPCASGCGRVWMRDVHPSFAAAERAARMPGPFA
jgi:hypothetical protein